MKPSSMLRRVATATSMALFLGADSTAGAPLQEACADPSAGPVDAAFSEGSAIHALRASDLTSTWLEHEWIARLGLLSHSSVVTAPGTRCSRHLLDGLPGPASAARGPRSLYEATMSLESGEVHAIQRHLGFVLECLETRDVSSLTPALRERRELQIEHLCAYRERAIFPRNGYVPDLAPVFIDAQGRSCAVAYLMIESGARELAESVAALENLAYVPEITAPGVARWIEESGLDVEECAMIQPCYCPPRRAPLPPPQIQIQFFGGPRRGPPPLTVGFMGYFYSPFSTTWNWDFGDGGTSNLQDPTHTYTAPGRYTVSLTATSLFSSATLTKVRYIRVLP